MRISAGGNLIVETVILGVRVMRFVRPDLRKYLDDDADAPTSALFREIQDTALSNLADGSVLIVNMGLTIGEIFQLDELADDCARDGVYECFFSAPPLPITGAVGSPINPVAPPMSTMT